MSILSDHLLDKDFYNFQRAVAPKLCTCCSPPYQIPSAFLNNATLNDPVLRHHVNIASGRPNCGFEDCSICLEPYRRDTGIPSAS